MQSPTCAMPEDCNTARYVLADDERRVEVEERGVRHPCVRHDAGLIHKDAQAALVHCLQLAQGHAKEGKLDAQSM